MRYGLIAAMLMVCAAAPDPDGLVRPKTDFSAIAVQESGAYRATQTIHYGAGKLRIDGGNGFSTTILDLTTQTQCLLMVNHTYLVLPMDDQLYRRFIARDPDTTGARKVGKDMQQGLQTTKYAFGDDGPLDAAGFYWLTADDIMVRREYDDGVFGRNAHHVDVLTDMKLEPQAPTLFEIPAGYTLAR